MGADQFMRYGYSAHSAKEAFEELRSDALYEHGHGGYTGTIGEKHSFVSISVPDPLRKGPLPTQSEAQRYAEELLDANDPRVDEKWGPAGCIECVNECPGVRSEPGERCWLFFGWASS